MKTKERYTLSALIGVTLAGLINDMVNLGVPGIETFSAGLSVLVSYFLPEMYHLIK